MRVSFCVVFSTSSAWGLGAGLHVSVSRQPRRSSSVAVRRSSSSDDEGVADRLKKLWETPLVVESDSGWETPSEAGHEGAWSRAGTVDVTSAPEDEIFCEADEVASADCVDGDVFWDVDGSATEIDAAMEEDESMFCDVEDEAAAEDCVDESEFWAVEEEPDYGVVDSHLIVDVVESGAPARESFVYVDERACVGCNACASIAPSTSGPRARGRFRRTSP